MSNSIASVDGPANEREFDAALRRLIRSARKNGVDVEGGWEVVGEESLDLGIEIYKVARSGRSGEERERE